MKLSCTVVVGGLVKLICSEELAYVSFPCNPQSPSRCSSEVHTQQTTNHLTALPTSMHSEHFHPPHVTQHAFHQQNQHHGHKLCSAKFPVKCTLPLAPKFFQFYLTKIDAFLQDTHICICIILFTFKSVTTVNNIKSVFYTPMFWNILPSCIQ